MPYIQKDAQGNVTGVALAMQREVDGTPQAGWIAQPVADDHPDVVAFRAPKPKTEAMTVEDLATALIGKGLIDEQDLDAAQGGK